MQAKHLFIALMISVATLSFSVSGEEPSDGALTQLERLLDRLQPQPQDRAEIKSIAINDPSPAVAQRIAEAIRTGELQYEWDIMRKCPEDVYRPFLTPLLYDTDDRVVHHAVAFQERTPDVGDLVNAAVSSGNHRLPHEFQELLIRCIPTDKQVERLVSRATADEGDARSISIIQALREVSLSGPRIEQLAACCVSGQGDARSWEILCRLREQELTNSRRNRLAKHIEEWLVRDSDNLGHCAEFLRWSDGEAARELVLRLLNDRIPRLISKESQILIDILSKCHLSPDSVEKLLEVAEKNGVSENRYTVKIKQLSTPEIPLTVRETLETDLLVYLGGVLVGLDDVGSVTISEGADHCDCKNDDIRPLFAYSSWPEYFSENDTEVRNWALERLERTGDPNAALVLGYLKERRALPLLRFWYLHGGAVGGTLGDGAPTLYLEHCQYAGHLAYEKAIHTITGKSLREIITLNPMEREWLKRKIRRLDYENPRGLENYAARIWFHLEPDLATEEFCRLFRTARRSRIASLMAGNALGVMLMRHPTQDSVRRLIGEPDATIKRDTSSALPDYKCRGAEDWDERWLYRVKAREYDTRAHGVGCFFQDSELLLVQTLWNEQDLDDWIEAGKAASSPRVIP
jgi:hypothetical protein